MKLAISTALATAFLLVGSAAADTQTPAAPQVVTPAVDRAIAGQTSKQIADAVAQGQERTRADAPETPQTPEQ
jgi:hypothetical protein